MVSRGHRHRRQKLQSKVFVCLRALHVHSPSFPSLVNEPLPGDPLVFKRMSFLPIVLIDRLLGRGARERLDEIELTVVFWKSVFGLPSPCMAGRVPTAAPKVSSEEWMLSDICQDLEK